MKYDETVFLMTELHTEPRICHNADYGWYIAKYVSPDECHYLHKDSLWRRACNPNGWYKSLEEAESILNSDYPEPDFVVEGN